MATPPDFSVGQVLTAAHMDAVGLWLVKTQTFSATTNCDVTDVFSADYENYLVVARFTSSLTGQYTNVQLLNGTTPKTTNYDRSAFFSTVTNTNFSDSGGTGQNGWRLAGQSSTGIYAAAYLYRPFTSAETGYHVQATYGGVLWLSAGVQTESYSATGFRILANGNAATYTGTVRVYGYRN